MAKKVVFDTSKLESILLAQQGKLIHVMAEVIRAVPNFAPQDTQTMISTHFVERIPKGYILYYGSINDNSYNKQVIAQHETPLRHYGSPAGKSMRLGVIGTAIPGTKYLVGGVRQIGNIIKIQRADYQKGYRQKLKSGVLTSPYPTKFLSKALDSVVRKGLKNIIGA